MVLLRIFLVVLVGSLAVSVIDCCSCMPGHPQAQFCTSSYVIKGRIIEKTALETQSYSFLPGTLVYTVRVEVVYKGAQHVSAGQNIEISTSADGAMCGLTWMQKDQKYIIMGYVEDGELKIHMCDYVTNYSSLSYRQKQGMKNYWEQDCGICTPHTCMGRACSPNDSCHYDPPYNGEPDCELQFARCTKDDNGECNWFGKESYEECKSQRSL